jgi:hypothetical protein
VRLMQRDRAARQPAPRLSAPLRRAVHAGAQEGDQGRTPALPCQAYQHPAQLSSITATISSLPVRKERRSSPSPVTGPAEPGPPDAGTSTFQPLLSRNRCPVDEAAEPLVVSVMVAPDDVAADHAGLLLVVGAVEREVLQRGELASIRATVIVQPRGALAGGAWMPAAARSGMNVCWRLCPSSGRPRLSTKNVPGSVPWIALSRAFS